MEKLEARVDGGGTPTCCKKAVAPREEEDGDGRCAVKDEASRSSKEVPRFLRS